MRKIIDNRPANIREIVAKGCLKKGLSLEDVSLLVNCEEPSLISEIFSAATASGLFYLHRFMYPIIA
ncbi:MAG: hypothetical protein HYY43_02075 [Deltaproteobacteria bacterium]|nr:hypothetical protein [Deltaproteobacteria bacterium]